MRLVIRSLFPFLAVASLVNAQSVPVVSFNTPLVATFDSGLPSAAVTFNWLDGEIFPGWYAYEALGLGAPGDYRITSGQSTGIHLYQQRQGADATDGALSLQPKLASGAVMVGWRLLNDTGAVVDAFSLSYVGEQWYVSTAGERPLLFSYQLGATDVFSGEWTGVEELNFVSPKHSITAATLNETLPENSVVIDPVIVSGLNWQPGTEL